METRRQGDRQSLNVVTHTLLSFILQATNKAEINVVAAAVVVVVVVVVLVAAVVVVVIVIVAVAVVADQ
jgi:hypothetical protein